MSGPRVVVIGAGYIGLELGTVWRRLGAKVTVVEFLDRVTPGMDLEVSRQFQRLLSRQGLGFKLGTKVTDVDASGDRLLVTTEAAEGGEAEKMKADVVLVKNDASPVSFPLLNPFGHVAFQAQRGDVHTVVVDGRVVKSDGKLVGILSRADLMFIGQDLKPTIESGSFDLWVGPSATQGLKSSFVLAPEPESE